MNTLLLLLRKDLLRRRRAPLAVVALLLFPLMFSGLIALAFGRGDQPLPPARLLIEDHDEGLASRVVGSFFSAEELRRFVVTEPAGENGRARLAAGEASALLILPAGLTDRILAGERVQLELLRNPAESILPQVAEEISRTLTDVLSIAAEILKSQSDALGITNLQSFEQLDAAGFGRFGMAAQRLGRSLGPYLDLKKPVLQIEAVKLDKQGQPVEKNAEGKKKEDGPSLRTLIFLMVLPGVMVYSLFSIGEQMMRDLLFESSSGTLRRQLCAPISVAQVIAAKVLVAATVAGGALVLMMGLAVMLTGKSVDPVAFAVHSLAIVLAVSGASATLYGLARSERQGAAMANMVYLLMAFLGGSFIPLDSLPAAARNIAPISPFYWGTRGFQDLLEGAGLGDILPAIGILLALGVSLLVVGSLLLGRRFTQGKLS